MSIMIRLFKESENTQVCDKQYAPHSGSQCLIAGFYYIRKWLDLNSNYCGLSGIVSLKCWLKFEEEWFDFLETVLLIKVLFTHFRYALSSFVDVGFLHGPFNKMRNSTVFGQELIIRLKCGYFLVKGIGNPEMAIFDLSAAALALLVTFFDALKHLLPDLFLMEI